MSTTKHKSSKQHLKEKDKEDNKKFVAILVIATIVLMVLMYFIFVR